MDSRWLHRTACSCRHGVPGARANSIGWAGRPAVSELPSEPFFPSLRALRRLIDIYLWSFVSELDCCQSGGALWPAGR
jgi:hypothetical protein